ncbi:hemoglobin [Fibrella aestuarina BUZ 2]|uniref:Hemoglobin n=1 Tax=Fibrella aestuarina BUZ 2 TaxID=1166018 RepID=I0K2I7_9BACT|nr:group II truncated hemoglobin [Fibrella aestuarina]CCG98340.1 hemoglobin [Fibrella aestuarina BUZ 2]
MDTQSIPTLYDWAGGNEKLEQLTTLFYSKVHQDALLEPVFRHMSPEHAQHVAHFIGEVFGGPTRYTHNDHGSHASMVAHHIGKHLTEGMRKRWMHLLLESADELGLPSDPEFRSALVGYLEWGSRIAVLNSTATENPIQPNEPMPRWGWGVPGGPYQP